MTNLWKYFWLHTRKSWKIHVVFMMVSVGFWPLGSKNYPELKEDGDWPDPALRCEITPGSHVFLLSLFTLRFQKSRQIACNGTTDLLQATSLVQMQPLIFFLLFFYRHSCGDEKVCAQSSHVVARGQSHMAVYYSKSGGHFGELFPARFWVKGFHTVIDSFS